MNKLWLVVILAGVFYVAGQYIASQPDRIKQEAELNREITVQGSGEALQRPDVARVVLATNSGIQTNAEQALSVIADKINQVIKALKDAGIAEEDIKTTGLSVNPSYDYTDGRQNLRGFEAREELTVTIRELDKIGELVGQATALGINQVGGVSFEVDDPSEIELAAQADAIQDARQKAEALAASLGVRLGQVKNFQANTSQAGTEPVLYRNAVTEDSKATVPLPEVATGTQTVKADVSITYELQ